MAIVNLPNHRWLKICAVAVFFISCGGSTAATLDPSSQGKKHDDPPGVIEPVDEGQFREYLRQLAALVDEVYEPYQALGTIAAECDSASARKSKELTQWFEKQLAQNSNPPSSNLDETLVQDIENHLWHADLNDLKTPQHSPARQKIEDAYRYYRAAATFADQSGGPLSCKQVLTEAKQTLLMADKLYTNQNLEEGDALLRDVGQTLDRVMQSDC